MAGEMKRDIETAEDLGELRAEVRNLNAMRAEMLSLIRDLQYELRAMRAEIATTRAAQERLVNRGYGVLLGVAVAGGTVGAAAKTFLGSFFSHP